MIISINKTQLPGEDTPPVFSVVIQDDDNGRAEFYRNSEEDANTLHAKLSQAFNGGVGETPKTL